MIPLLLWRCPLCAANDSLQERSRLFRPNKIHCTNCRTIWLARREVGVDCWLRVLESPSYPDAVGVEQRSKDWYKQIKNSFKLLPLEGHAVPMEAGERLYLISRKTELKATADNSIFFEPGPTGDSDELRKTSLTVGEGRILLTNQRLIWESEAGRTISLALSRLNSVSALRNKDLILLYEIHMISLSFKEESLLKWLTYFSEISKEVQRDSGHLFTTSRF